MNDDPHRLPCVAYQISLDNGERIEKAIEQYKNPKVIFCEDFNKIKEEANFIKLSAFNEIIAAYTNNDNNWVDVYE